MMMIPPDLRAMRQKPYAPRPASSIAKAKTRPGDLPRAQFAMQKWLDDKWQMLQKDSQGPKCCAIERSPGAGRRRRILKEAKAIIASLPHGLERDEANGNTMKSGVVVARWLRTRSSWSPTQAWTATMSVEWKQLDELLQKLM